MDGKEISGLWEECKKTEDENYLIAIAQHNLWNLIKEAFLAMWIEPMKIALRMLKHLGNVKHFCYICGKEILESPNMVFIQAFIENGRKK